MEQKIYPRGEILRTLTELAKEVSNDVFVTTRPQATSEQLEDFVLVRLPQNIRQEGDAGQYTYGQFSMFARDIEGRYEDVMRLDEMQSAITEMFPIVTPTFTATRPLILAGGTDQAGFHFITIQFEIQITI
ncbi:hypothetical protein [uncultured Duncaniella sp.]|jgi:hypothetical protein|uniref:hypothetical protein n=1 Tax=uncultured Duncaniella sp. TaxID=2768039 RepID=UPI002659274B|nr:hypothetical protein [uncultured Duncaniella sp.]